MRANGAKRFLQQIEKLDTLISNKLIEQSQWKSIALSVTAQMNGERVQSSSNPQKMADAINKCVDMGAEIDLLIDELILARHEITSVIEQLSAAEYDVLHRVYIQHKTLDEVAAAKDRSKSWVTTVHGRALQNVQRILDAREEAAL